VDYPAVIRAVTQATQVTIAPWGYLSVAQGSQVTVNYVNGKIVITPAPGAVFRLVTTQNMPAGNIVVDMGFVKAIPRPGCDAKYTGTSVNPALGTVDMVWTKAAADAAGVTGIADGTRQVSANQSFNVPTTTNPTGQLASNSPPSYVDTNIVIGGSTYASPVTVNLTGDQGTATGTVLGATESSAQVFRDAGFGGNLGPNEGTKSNIRG
jgi:hypothetical protein